jgi:dolichol-phosphate mannosyltransferase
MIFRKKIFIQIIKFGIVGVSNFFVNLSVLSLLTHFFGIYYLFSAVISFLVSNINSFIWNNRWTFEEKSRSHTLSKYSKFLIVNLNALVIELFLLFLFTEFFGFYYLISQGIAILFSFLVNFLFNKRFVFKGMSLDGPITIYKKNQK